MLKISPLCLILFGLLINYSLAQTSILQPDRSEIYSNDSFEMEMPFKNCTDLKNNFLTEINIASDNDQIIISLLDGTVLSIDRNVNKIQWETNLGGEVVQTPYLFGNSLAVISKTKSNSNLNAKGVRKDENTESQGAKYFLRLLNKNNGLVKWQIPLDTLSKTESNNFGIYSSDSKRLTIIDENGILYLLNTTDGKTIARKELRLQMSTESFFVKQTILLGTASKEILRMSTETLEVIERIKVSAVPTIISFFEDNIIWGDEKGRLIFIANGNYKNKYSKRLKEKNSETSSFTKKWELRMGGKISNIIPYKRNLLITSFDNYVYLVTAESGEIIWKRRLPNRPVFKPMLIENYAVIMTVGDSTAMIIELKSGKPVNKIDISNDNFFTGNSGKISSFLFFPTARGLLFYTSAKECI